MASSTGSLAPLNNGTRKIRGQTITINVKPKPKPTHRARSKSEGYMVKNNKVFIEPLKIDDVEKHKSEYNTNNHLKLAPYKYDEKTKTFTINKKWKDEITVAFMKSLVQDTKCVECDTITKEDRKFNAVEWDIYTRYMREYDYHKFSIPLRNVLPEHKVITISKEDRKVLHKLSTINILTDQLLGDELIDLSKELMTELEKAIAHFGKDVFVKLSTTSSKNQQKLYPLHCAEEVISFLTQVPQFNKEYEKEDNDIKIIVMKWNHEIEKRIEFRVFVYQNQVTGITQQNWYTQYEDLGVAKKELEKQGVAKTDKPDNKAVIELDEFTIDKGTNMQLHMERVAHEIDAFVESIKALNLYKSGVFDVWLDGSYKVHLIEINPWGAWSSSGSGLFKWEKDYEKLYNVNGEIYVRYLA